MLLAAYVIFVAYLAQDSPMSTIQATTSGTHLSRVGYVRESDAHPALWSEALTKRATLCLDRGALAE